MKVIGYVRVSTDEQVSTGISLDVQEEKINAYCRAKDWELVKIVRDPGLSAKNLRRPGLQSILEIVPKRNGKRGFDGIVVVKLDRLTRSVGDLAYLNRLFESIEFRKYNATSSSHHACLKRLILEWSLLR
jgi:DNA invertase Pin-like site-specific DNA recombinase